ncbi:MAG: ribosome small subunit-dependent GTPase A [Bacilli bacterium]|nr:ribosome small subunit-dependent GTPase A [Bacilli bacterium]
MKGQIVKIVSDLHYVKYENSVYPCKCRGYMRHEHILPLVGDYVLFDTEKLVIDRIEPRKNCFKRPKVSNIDQAFIITSLVVPDFSLNLLDKFIIHMELNHVEPIIIITKGDLVDDMNKFDEDLEYYKKIGYKVLFNTELDEISKLLKDKVSVFTGQTGAGKSTLINKLDSTYDIEVGEVSLALGRGRHTTRETSMYELCGGLCIDTPGFSALDLGDYSKEEIRDAFIEFKNYNCEYRDCMHKNTDNCGVYEAVLDNNILKSRYINYLKFIGDDYNES